MKIEEFRMHVRACKTWDDLSVFLDAFNKKYGYGLTAPRKEIPFEEIQFTKKGLVCPFYQQGGRTYKTIQSFAKHVVFWNAYHIRPHQHHYKIVYIQNDTEE